MRVLSRRLWWYSLLVLTGMTLATRQILTPSLSVQAQVTPANPPTVPAEWYPASQDTSFPDANSACEAYSYQFKSDFDGTIHTRQFKEITELLYRSSGSGEVYGATCLITRSPEGDDYPAYVKVICPFTGDPSNTYFYSGGLNGKCRLVDNSSSNPPTTNELPNYEDTSLSGIRTTPFPFEAESPLTTGLEILLDPTPLNTDEPLRNEAPTTTPPTETADRPPITPVQTDPTQQPPTDSNTSNGKPEKVPDRTEPRNEDEEIALKKAKEEPGERIMKDKIKDTRYPKDEFAKKRYVYRDTSDGKPIAIHYWEEIATGRRFGFKFK
jgi:hypothetical protein